MKTSDLRGQTEQELRETEVRLRRELFGHRMQNHTGQLADTSQLRKLRRDIARVKGVLSANVLGAQPQRNTREGSNS